MTKKILIVGGTGMLGRPVVRRLHNDGYKIRVLTHNIDRANKFFGDEIEKVVADVTEIDSLKTAIEGCDTVYINLNARMDLAKYETIEVNGTKNIVDVAKRQGVRRIAMISSICVNDLEAQYKFIETKLKTERFLVRSGIPYTIFRCSWFYESLPLFVQGKKAILLGNQMNPVSWLSASDYAGIVSRAFELEGTTGKIYIIKGQEWLSIGDALARFCDWVTPETKLSPVTFWLASIGGLLSRRNQMKGLIEFMKYYDSHQEPDISSNSEDILGPATMTLEAWAVEYRKKLKLFCP